MFPHGNRTVPFTAIAPESTAAPGTGRRSAHTCAHTPMSRVRRGRSGRRDCGAPRAARPGRPRPPPARARSRRPRRLTPAPFSILRLAGSLPRTDPKVCPRPQRLSPLGVSRTLLPERRRPSLIGAQLSVPGKKRSSDWPRRLRTSESGEAWPCLPGGSAPAERTSAGSPLPRARELAPAVEVVDARFC